MKTIEIIGSNFTGTVAHTRVACRGIVLREGRLLLSYAQKAGWYLIPGGGLEDGESPEECCARELLEETGRIVTPGECFLTIKEYYSDWCFISHYFPCALTGQGQQNLTEQEISQNLVPEWVDFDKAYAIFAAHAHWASENEEKRGSYLREHTALTHFQELFL